MTVEELLAADLHRDLPGIFPDAQTIGELVSRAMLRDSEGVVRFPANVMKEARAARALLAAGDRGAAVLREHVLVDLRETDAAGDPVRGVESTWSNVLELLLQAAEDPRWAETVEPYDGVLVARATRTSAPREEREAAINSLWAAYLARRIWFDRRASTGNGSGDEYALKRLFRAGVPETFQDTIRAAMTDDERTTRGNAVELISLVLPLPGVDRGSHAGSSGLRLGRASPCGRCRLVPLAENFPELSTHTEELLRPYVEAMSGEPGHAIRHGRDGARDAARCRDRSCSGGARRRTCESE